MFMFNSFFVISFVFLLKLTYSLSLFLVNNSKLYYRHLNGVSLVFGKKRCSVNVQSFMAKYKILASLISIIFINISNNILLRKARKNHKTQQQL